MLLIMKDNKIVPISTFGTRIIPIQAAINVQSNGSTAPAYGHDRDYWLYEGVICSKLGINFPAKSMAL